MCISLPCLVYSVTTCVERTLLSRRLDFNNNLRIKISHFNLPPDTVTVTYCNPFCVSVYNSINYLRPVSSVLTVYTSHPYTSHNNYTRLPVTCTPNICTLFSILGDSSSTDVNHNIIKYSEKPRIRSLH